MAMVKQTKTELKRQKDRLKGFERFLPTLKIKQQLLQKEALKAKAQVTQGEQQIQAFWAELEPWVGCFAQPPELSPFVQIKGVSLRKETVAGVPIRYLADLQAEIPPYDLHQTPLWVDQGLESLLQLVKLRLQLTLAQEAERALTEELTRTNQRINLFEKIKIPQTQAKIKQISLVLDDQAAAAVGWARGAKKKRLRQASVAEG